MVSVIGQEPEAGQSKEEAIGKKYSVFNGKCTAKRRRIVWEQRRSSNMESRESEPKRRNSVQRHRNEARPHGS